MFKLLQRRVLPNYLFTDKPDYSDGGRVLVLGENVLCAGEDDCHIGPVAPVFVLCFKAACYGGIIGRRDFLQFLGKG